MLEFIFFITIVILLFWVGSLSSRVSVLERKQREVQSVNPPLVYKPEREMAHNGIMQPEKQLFNQPILEVPIKPAEMVARKESAEKTSAQEAEKAVNWLNRIGVVALVLGLGFFLKIAIDLGWIGPWAQIILAVAVGGLLIYLGEIWKEKFGERALALSGGGIAILYFSIFAAFNFYHLVSQPIAFIFMVATAGFAVWQAHRNNSLTLGALAFFGAYGAPLMLSTGTDHQVILFAYLTVINISAIAVMVKKFWSQLLILTIIGSIIDFSIWSGSYSNYQNTLTSLTFLIITSVVYAVGAGILIRLHSENKTLPEDFENNSAVLQLINGVFYFVSIYALLSSNYHDILPAVALLGAVVFFFTYALVDRLNHRNLNYSISFIASILLVFAAVWKFDGKALDAAFLVIGLLGVTVGTLVKKEDLRVWGIIVLFVSLLASLFEPYGIGDSAFLFNAKFGLMFANTLAMLYVGWLYQKVETSSFEKDAEKVFQIAAALVFWGIISWDIFLPSHGISNADSYMTLWWIIYPVALAAAAIFGKRAELGKVALILLAASFFKVLFLPYTGEYQFLYNIKFGLMALETAALLGMAYMWEKANTEKSFSDALKVLASLLFWFAVSIEIGKYFENDISKNARNLYLSLWWIAYSAVLMGAGIMWRSAIFRKISLGLFFVTIAKVFLFDLLSLDLGYLIVSFISLGVILISVSFFYRKKKDVIDSFLNENH